MEIKYFHRGRDVIPNVSVSLYVSINLNVYVVSIINVDIARALSLRKKKELQEYKKITDTLSKNLFKNLGFSSVYQ